MSELWPSRHEPPAPALPRAEDLPIVPEGYDRQKVREAFDAFYRHAAQLDAALRTLEAVEAFQRSAAELRGDLRAIRAAGFTTQSWQRSYEPERRSGRPILPEAFPRVAAEVVFLIAVAVVLGVSNWGALPVIGVMALALGIVWVVEWLASRERPLASQARSAPTRPATPPVPAPAEADAPIAVGWAAFAEPEEDRADAMTMVEPLPRPEPIAELEPPASEEAAAEEDEAAEPARKLAVPPETEGPEEHEEAVDAQPALEPDAKPAAVAPAEAEEGEPGVELEASAEPDSEGAPPKPPAEVEVEEPQPAASTPEPADEEPALTEAELVEEPVVAAEFGEAAAAAEEESVEVRTEEAGESFWQRLRGRPSAPEPVLLEPPASHVRVLSEEDEALALDAEDAEAEGQIDELGVVAAQDDDAGPGTRAEGPPPRRRFWQGRTEPQVEAEGGEPEAAAEFEDEVEPEPFRAEAAIDPWEQGFELPSEPELELVEAGEPVEAEQEAELAEAAQLDGRETSTDGRSAPEQVVLAEDEPLVRDQTDDEEESAEPAETAHSSEASSADEAVPAEQDEPPIEVLAEQAAAALERSRARRRHNLRRARRR